MRRLQLGLYRSHQLGLYRTHQVDRLEVGIERHADQRIEADPHGIGTLTRLDIERIG